MSSDGDLPDRADVVVIGAGAVGCSVAYHLTELGRDDVVVLEKGSIVETGGSSTHAPGGLFQTNPNKTMATLANYTQNLYADLGGFKRTGGIELATTDERWRFLERRLDHSTSWGIDGAELLSPAEVADRSPLVDPSAIEGGYYVPTDGQLYPLELLEAFVERSRDGGARFFGHTTVTDVETAGGRVSAVVTDRGRIRADDVVVAGNIWAPEIGEMVGVDIPIVTCEHQYAVTSPIDELEGAEEMVEQPWLRHQDAAMYFRQHGDAFGVGSYNHEPLLLPADRIPDHDDDVLDAPISRYDGTLGDRDRYEFPMPSSKEFTEADFEAAWAEARRILPALEGAEVVEGLNGLFGFTPDGMPILGETPTVDGCWLAVGVWLTHAGGVGKVVAEMLTGTPTLDVTGCSVSRLQSHAGSSTFAWERGYQQYDEVYDIVHPRAPASVERGLRRSPFYHHQSALDAEFANADGWERPRWYGSNERLLESYADDVPDRSGWAARHWSPIEGAEHLAVRDGVGLFDLSNFTPVAVEGPEAPAFVQRLFTNDLDVPVGRVTYTTMLDEGGGILGDMTVVRRAPTEFLVMAGGGASGSVQFDWIREQAPDDGSVTVSNLVSARCGVGVWGPDARALLESVCEADLSNDAFPYFSARETYVGSVPVLALRVSYVGELGWELYAPAEYGGKLWELLADAGAAYDAVPMGDGALNTMRLEKGFRLWGSDITPEFGPYEASLDVAVEPDSGPFVGQDALPASGDDVDRRLSCLTLDDPSVVVVPGSPIVDPEGETTLGYCTSADYGYSVGSCIAYGYLPAGYDAGSDVQVQYEADRYDATVRTEPLFDPDRERLLADG